MSEQKHNFYYNELNQITYHLDMCRKVAMKYGDEKFLETLNLILDQLGNALEQNREQYLRLKDQKTD